MISISKLYCGASEPLDALRYGNERHRRPVIVWNVTRRCNLKCVHCYSNSLAVTQDDELRHEESEHLIRDVSSFEVPVILFSGGEPLMRDDIFELAHLAVKNGIRVVLSTNGLLLSQEKADLLKKIGISYVGISLDGVQDTHDRFRGMTGAFEKTLKAIRNCQEAGLKVGIRFTMNRRNVSDIPAIFELIENEDIPRACFYHLVYSGRGSHLINEGLTHEETRKVLDFIIEKTRDLFERGKSKEILTVDNHADGPYVYMKLRSEQPARAEEALVLLRTNGGNSSGSGIGCVSWDGEVHPDQFWRNISFGNIRKRPFSEIWTDTSNHLVMQLRNKKQFLKGRCAMCRWLDVCGGNFRARAEALTGDIWAPDPACYLTQEEIT